MLVFHIVTILWLITTTAVGVGNNFADLDQYLDPFDPNPRFIVKNGHLMVLTGRNKDLVFRSSGSGRVKINGEDIAALKQSSGTSPDQSNVNPSNALDITGSSLNQLVDARVAVVENKVQLRLESINSTVQLLMKLNSATQRRRLRNLIRKVNKLERLLNKNECLSNPCQNGADCEDGYNRYFCRCVEGFQGKNCEQDVDECAHYQGTELGCQNGGTCLNTFGSFHCLCPANFQGVRCTIEFNDCRNTSNHEICGNGVCFNLPRNQNGMARYRCVCYQGFTKSVSNSESAPCDQDIDECATGVHHCSKNPLVSCINTRSGYTCGPCPIGYSGDGFTCSPTDLCQINNGGCSISPRVSCFSNQGRVVCGSCPPGFVGDGTICSQIDGDICSANNGGCFASARCQANSAISATYRDCLCPVGFTGNGIGPNGCIRVSGNSGQSCANNPCLNSGTCMSYQNGVYCICTSSFSGIYCEKPVNACAINPCRNNGVCVSMQGTYSCICSNEYSGQNCELPRSPCGGVLDSEAGILSYPISNGTTYANNVTCVWLIKNSNAEGKVLNITFTKFRVETSSRCAFDFVEIFDGPSREYKSFGRFCGYQMPKKTGIFISSFNSVILHFQSDVSVGSDGFMLNWITIEPTCGGLISNLTHGMIESPGFPHHYPDRLDCHWEFVVEYGKRIQFIFNHLDIESNVNCSFDYIEFKEGLSLMEKGNTIARFCNWTSSSEYTVPPPITTSGSFARVHFHSDTGVNAKGFQLLFHQVPGVCGGLLTGSSGIFGPPTTSFTSSITGRTTLVYENNIVCDWLIRVMPDERISLRFLMFSLEADAMVINRGNLRSNYTTNCMFDYVEVYDGEDFRAPMRSRLCGRTIPPEIISTGRFLRVKFRSDMSVAYRGFTAQFNALCGGEFNEREGVIESPNYPAPLVSSRNCTFLLHAPVGHIIKFDIESMDIEFDHRCYFDYLLVEGRRFCGRYPPPPIYSMTDELRVVFVNDDTKPSKGFRARYSSVEVGCGGTLKQGDPIIAITPDNIKANPVINQCLWEIRANKSFIVLAKFLHPETVPTNSGARLNRPLFSIKPCFFNTSYIMVNDSDGTLIKKFCPEELPPPITSTGEKLFITYIFRPPPPPLPSPIDPNLFNLTYETNWTSLSTIQTPFELIQQILSTSFESKSFYANYFFIKERNFCGRNLFSSSGVIRSPQYPRRYPPNRNCTWVIHVDNGLQVKLNFTVFQLEPQSEVNGQCYDYLEIRNGKRSDSPLIGKFCGNGPLPDIVSHSNYLFLRFISDPSMQNRGFQVYYQAMETGCGGLLTGESGSIESPDYPNFYFSNMNCEWKIRVSEGSVVVLYITAIDIEVPPNGQCQFDYLEFFDSENDGGRSFGRFCSNMGGLNKNMFTSTSNKMFIRFTTDATINHGGFKLNYRTECNRTLTGRYGVIESPNYPFSHPHNMNCNWHILAPMGNNVTVSFTSMSLESGIDCMFDHINISEVNRYRPISMSLASQVDLPTYPYNLTTKKVLCGNYSGNLPAPIKLSTNEVLIKFYSDESRSVDSGFRLEWGAVGCGGEYIDRPSGTISSPGFPNPYPRDLECLWHIKAPDGNRVDLVVDTLDIEYSKTCNFDYVEVFGGPDENSPQISRLCNQATNMHISSVGSYMTIKLVSDISMARRGFLAKFTTDSRGCGGRFSTDTGTLTSPNYGRGNQYDANSDCAYRINSFGNFDIELTINDFQIPDKSPNCSNSYLAIYDADSEVENKLVVKLCGEINSATKSVYRSSDSSLYLRFKGDSVNSGRGFNVTYRKVCGKTVLVSDQENYKVITSANYPHIVSNDEQCNFILKAANPADTVTVRFTHIQSFNLPFEIHPRVANECSISFIEFYEGKDLLEHKRKLRYCLQAIPPPTISSGDTMLLITHFTVFRALVSSVKSFCGGDFNAIEGYITNPGYPNSYPLNIECIWVLKASPGNRYVLEFTDFDLEDSEYCNGDYLEIRQSNSSGQLIGDRRLCGNDKDSLPNIDFSYSGDIWIKFRTDEANVAKGFMLHFQTASNVILNGDSGQVASPGYPNSFHFYNRTFTWSIVVSPNRYVKLNFVELDLMGDTASFGFCSIQLSIYNGLVDFNQMDSPSNQKQVFSTFQMATLPEPKATYCSSLIPAPFVSDNNVVTLMYFAPYYSHLPTKFLLKWSAINQSELAAFDEHSEGIPSDVNSTFSVFVEKGQQFNLFYDNFTQFGNDINWYFTTRSSMHFNLTVSLLSFHPSTSCWFNKFTVYNWQDSGKKWNVLKKLCNGYASTTELGGTNLIRIHLQYAKASEVGIIKPRYNMTIFPICGGNFTEPRGTIDTEDALDGRGSMDCRWLIKVRPGRTIKITVEYFSVGFQSVKCVRQYLQIRNGHSDESPLLLQPLCGQNTTSFLAPETSGNNALILYKSTSTNNNFRIHYEEVGLECGGEIILKSSSDVVSISSPEYPDSPSHDVTCEWIVRGPLESGLQLSFTPERWTGCDMNNSFVEVYNGGSDLSGLIQRYCMPPYNLNSIIISSHITLIRFVLRKRDFHTKFNATLKPDNCNREYFISGVMNDLQLPILQKGGLPDFNSRCTTRIRTHPNYYIVLNVTSLYLEGNNCSSGDVVEFRDSEESAFAFNRFCAPRNASTFEYQLSSMENEVFVVYQRVNYQASPNASTTKKIGVKFSVEAKYRKCVRTINAKLNPTGVIRSPNFPLPVNRRFHCYWRLIGDIGSRFVLHFNRFNLGDAPTNVNISMFRCSKKLMVWKNLYATRNMISIFGCSNELPADISSLSHMMSLSLMANELKEREGFSLSYRMIYDNESCSAYFDSPRGQVASSNFDNLNYSGPVGCAWEINLSVNQSGTLLLDTYDVAGDCSNSSLSTTGVSDDSHNFFWSIVCITKENSPQTKGKKYVLPIYRRMEDNQHPMVLFNFNRTIAGQSKGLRGEYFIQNCGGYFNDFEGEISSPNYPNAYQTDTFCNWYFGLSQWTNSDRPGFSGYRLTFTEFDIGDNCDEEYFSIKPRFDMLSITKLCKKDGMPKPLYVGHDLLISFVNSRNLSLTGPSSSSSSATSSGKFKFQLDRASHGCGGLLISNTGYFQSTNYANISDTFSTNRQYTSNSECVWTIKSIPDFHLTFQFNSRFDIEESANCSNDYLLFEERRLDFVDGREVERWLPLKRLCGHSKPEQLTSQTNLVRATFRTNDKIVGDGFRVDYRQECGGLFQEESGTVISPHYTEGAYGNGLSCVYQIERAPHEYIRIEFEDFELESHAMCLFDSVTVFLGEHTNSTTPQYGPYCGTTLPPSLSSQGKIVVVFNTDSYLSKRGFKFRFEVTSCGGNITDSAGIIVSPEITRDLYKFCTWRITVPEPNNAVIVRITELDLANDHCRVDCCNYLKIHDGFYSEGTLLGYLCTNNHEELMYKSTGNQMMIRFRRGSLEINKAARFKLQYWSTPGSKAGCGGTLRAKEGVVSSPDIDGDSNYEPNLNCIWTISVNNVLTQFIELEFERFDVEEGNQTECDTDYLDVYDGTTMHAPLLAKLCGRITIPEKIHSTSNSLLLHFITNDNVTGHGFRARFSVQNRTCGGYIFPGEEKQVLTSPNYPNGYDVPLECFWLIGQNYMYYKKPMVLTFQDLDLNCSRGDYVQVIESRNSDYDSTVFKPITICSSPTKLKIVSNERMNLVMKVSPTAHSGGIAFDNQNFVNSLSNKVKDIYRGFSLTYHSSMCNETMDGLDNGYVFNRNFPQSDMIYRDFICYINISVPADRQIALYFSSFSFYHCHYSNLTILEGNSSLAKATYCNMANPPSPIFSTSNNLTVAIRASFMMRSSADYNKPNYKTNRILYSFNYLSSLRSDGPPGCGGNLTGPRGVFSSPNYPQPLNEDRVCTWLIHTNGYHTVTLKFDFFQLSPACQNNYLVVYDGEEDVEEKKLTTFCATDKPAPIQSQSNSLLVKLYTILGNYEPGFLASYQVNTKEPKIRGRVITSQTFKFYRFLNTYYDL